MATWKPASETITVGVVATAISASAKRVLGVTIQADDTNSDDIFVGDSSIDVSGSNKGIRLDAGESISLNDLFIGVGVNEWDLSEVYLRSNNSDQLATVIYPDLHKA